MTKNASLDGGDDIVVKPPQELRKADAPIMKPGREKDPCEGAQWYDNPQQNSAERQQ
jgi:hypothetical protein